jgi:hypothetical protein
METILLQLALFLLNILMGIGNHNLKNYKTSAFNFFVAGTCFTFIIVAILKL